MLPIKLQGRETIAQDYFSIRRPEQAAERQDDFQIFLYVQIVRLNKAEPRRINRKALNDAHKANSQTKYRTKFWCMNILVQN